MLSLQTSTLDDKLTAEETFHDVLPKRKKKSSGEEDIKWDRNSSMQRAIFGQEWYHCRQVPSRSYCLYNFSAILNFLNILFFQLNQLAAYQNEKVGKCRLWRLFASALSRDRIIYPHSGVVGHRREQVPYRKLPLGVVHSKQWSFPE